MSAFRLPAETRVRQVELRVPDTHIVAGFYENIAGLAAVRREGSRTSSGPIASEPLVILHEDNAAKPRPRRATGLYHLAIRYPTRHELAQALKRLIESDYPIEGASNHLVSEAIYLSDPAGNGVELYADVPREHWKWRDGQIVMATEPLDLGSLLKAAGAGPVAKSAASGTDIGHIHLHVAELPLAERFFHEFLGLDVTQRSYPGALFFSAGGYHHHIAANTWGGPSAPPADSTGLIAYRLEVPVAELLFTLRERAAAFGYKTQQIRPRESGEVLQIQDPAGAWLEIAAR